MKPLYPLQLEVAN